MRTNGDTGSDGRLYHRRHTVGITGMAATGDIGAADHLHQGDIACHFLWLLAQIGIDIDAKILMVAGGGHI